MNFEIRIREERETEFEHVNGYGCRVRDFLLMLKAEQEKFRFDMDIMSRFYPQIEICMKQEETEEATLEEAICCVEAVYRIEPKFGRKPEIRMPASFVINRLMVLINFYSTKLYGYWKCIRGEECGERMPECPDQCRFRGWEDEYCNMLREAIRCVEVTGTGVPEPPTIYLEDLRCQADRRIQYSESGEGNQEYRN